MLKSSNSSNLFHKKGSDSLLLVALGDSTPTGLGLKSKRDCYVHVYAGYIEQDLNTVVKVHNWSTNDLRTVSDWVKEVRKNNDLRKDLQNSDIVTLWLGWHNVIPCIIRKDSKSKPSFEKHPNIDALQKAISPMLAAFDSLLSEISSLAPPSETLILIADVAIPSLFVSKWKEFGTFDIWSNQAYLIWRNYIVQAANKHSIHIVPTYAVINNPDTNHTLPVEFIQDDGLHFTKKGHKLIADLHREIGYNYSGK